MEAGIYCPPEMTVELDHVLGLNSDFVKEVLLYFISDRSLSVPNVNRFFLYFWLKNKTTKFTLTDKQKLSVKLHI